MNTDEIEAKVDKLVQETQALAEKLGDALRIAVTQQKAVAHLLDRIQRDPDVHYLLGWGTESFRLLCAAEATATGRTFEAVEEERRRTAFACSRRFLSASEWAKETGRSTQEALREHVEKAKANFDLPEPCCADPQVFTTAATTNGQLMGPAKICRACHAWRFVAEMDWARVSSPMSLFYPEGSGFLIPEPTR